MVDLNTSLNRVSQINRITPVLALYKQPNYDGLPEGRPITTPFLSYMYDQQAKTQAMGLAGFLKSVRSVKNTADHMLNKETAFLQDRTAVSSNASKMTASAASGAAVKSYKVQFQSFAAAQTNAGSSLSKSSLTAINSGMNEMKLTIGDKSTSIFTTISSTDTNETALTKLKNSINKAKSGVTASIVQDTTRGTSKLNLQSDQTGTNQAFTLTDVTGNAASATGILNVSTTAANSSYRVNDGELQTSQSNTISLEDEKATATLIAPTTDSVQINIRPDEEKAVKEIKQLIDGYNEMHASMKEAGAYFNPTIKRRLEDAVDSEAYEQIGIRKTASGTLQLNEEKFRSSLRIDLGHTQSVIAGKWGLAKSLSGTAERFDSLPPIALLNRKLEQRLPFAAYLSWMPSNLQLPTTGTLFDRIF